MKGSVFINKDACSVTKKDGEVSARRGEDRESILCAKWKKGEVGHPGRTDKALSWLMREGGGGDYANIAGWRFSLLSGSGIRPVQDPRRIRRHWRRKSFV